MSPGRPARNRLDHGARKRKGDEYQEVDVNGKRISHKNTRRSLQKLVSLGFKETNQMANRTLNFGAGNGWKGKLMTTMQT